MKLVKILYGILIALVVFLAVLLFLSIFRIPGLPEVMIVRSGSMEPAVMTGSIVLVRPASEYTEGDIITFRREQAEDPTPITHRIVEVRTENGESYFTTKGDANDGTDANEVRESEVRGKVWFSVPFIGFLLAAARTPYGFTALIILPALLIIFDEGKKIWREVRRRKDEPKDGGLTDNQ